MKRLYITMFALLGWILAFAQSVYMHEAQEEAQEIDGISLWDMFSTLIFIAIIYVVVQSVRFAKYSYTQKKEIRKKEENQRILEDKFKCPICGKIESISYANTQYMQIKDGNRSVFHFVRLCKSCGTEHKEYMRKYYRWSKYDGTALPDSWCNIIFIITGIGILSLIGYHIYIQSMDFFWGRLIFGTIALFSIQVLVCKAFINIIKPIKPFSTPQKRKVIENNALEQ